MISKYLSAKEAAWVIGCTVGELKKLVEAKSEGLEVRKNRKGELQFLAKPVRYYAARNFPNTDLFRREVAVPLSEAAKILNISADAMRGRLIRNRKIALRYGKMNYIRREYLNQINADGGKA